MHRPLASSSSFSGSELVRISLTLIRRPVAPRLRVLRGPALGGAQVGTDPGGVRRGARVPDRTVAAARGPPSRRKVLPHRQATRRGQPARFIDTRGHGSGSEASRTDRRTHHRRRRERIRPLLPPQKPRVGGPRRDQRAVVEGLLWVPVTGFILARGAPEGQGRGRGCTGVKRVAQGRALAAGVGGATVLRRFDGRSGSGTLGLEAGAGIRDRLRGAHHLVQVPIQLHPVVRYVDHGLHRGRQMQAPAGQNPWVSTCKRRTSRSSGSTSRSTTLPI